MRRRGGGASAGLLLAASVAAALGARAGSADGAPPAPQAPLAPIAACATGGWERVNTPAGLHVQSLAGDPAGWVYAASRDASSQTLHRGPLTSPAQWAPIGALERVTDVGVQPGGGELVAGLFGDGVTRSADAGATFGPRQLAGSWVTAVAAAPFRLYAASSGPGAAERGVWLDADGSGAWQRQAGSETIDTIQFWELVVDPLGRPWAGTHGRGLWRAAPPPADPSAPAVWTPVGVDMPDATVMAVAFDAGDPDVVYAGLGEQPALGPSGRLGLRVSRDGGASWSRYPTVGGGTGGTVTAFDGLVVPAIAASATPGKAFASVWGRGLHLTLDGGRTWRPLPVTAAGAAYVSALLALVPADQTVVGCELLFAATTNGVWVRNVARLEPSTVFLPETQRTHPVPDLR